MRDYGSKEENVNFLNRILPWRRARIRAVTQGLLPETRKVEAVHIGGKMFGR